MIIPCVVDYFTQKNANIENIFPKGVSFSDFIATFAMLYQIFACFYFAKLR